MCRQCGGVGGCHAILHVVAQTGNVRVIGGRVGVRGLFRYTVTSWEREQKERGRGGGEEGMMGHVHVLQKLHHVHVHMIINLYRKNRQIKNRQPILNPVTHKFKSPN